MSDTRQDPLENDVSPNSRMYAKLFGRESLDEILARSAARVREIAQRPKNLEFRTTHTAGVAETVLYPASAFPARSETCSD